MSIVAPHVRKHLSADALFHLVRSGFASLPDHRLDETEISQIPPDSYETKTPLYRPGRKKAP
jgi:hypothetical protein